MKRLLYVVDDQVPVLETASFVLRMINRDWEVIGFNDPLKALAAARTRAPDLILSDQLMPGMEGSELLEQVRALSPATIRIIMSGYVPLDKLKLITSAHQYLAKPFDTSRLRDLIKRSFAAQERIVNPGLQTIVTGLRSIPSFPQVHHSLLRELEDDRSAGAAIARLVADDPGLSFKVLHLANSPMFGRGNLVTTPVDAVMCLGTDMISAIVLSQSLFRHYESVKRPAMDLKRVWTHSWGTAFMAQYLCREKSLGAKTGEEAFLAGLIHEIGRFVLVENFPDQFEAACDAARETGSPLVHCLREMFQASPAQVGAYVLELWGLSTEVIDAIAALDNSAADRSNAFTMPAALYIANHIASGKFPPDSFSIEEWNVDYLKSIGCEDRIAAWEEFFSQNAHGATGG